MPLYPSIEGKAHSTVAITPHPNTVGEFGGFETVDILPSPCVGVSRVRVLCELDVNLFGLNPWNRR